MARLKKRKKIYKMVAEVPYLLQHVYIAIREMEAFENES